MVLDSGDLYAKEWNRAPCLLPSLKIKLNLNKGWGIKKKRSLCDIGLGNNFLDMTAKAHATQENMDKLDLSKGLQDELLLNSVLFKYIFPADVSPVFLNDEFCLFYTI